MINRLERLKLEMILWDGERRYMCQHFMIKD